MKKLRKYLLAVLITTVVFNQAWAQQSPYTDNEDYEVGIIERLDQYVPDDIMLTNEDGELVNFKSLIDKPTAISFVYFRCPGICTPLMNGMAEVVGKSDMVIGEEYQFLTVSFDHTETYDVAKKKKNNYLGMIEKEVDPNGWRFLTGDSASVYKLTDALGFRFKKEENEFVHTATLIVVSPEGKITRYLNGTYFLPFDLKMAMVEAAKGKSGPTINKVLQYCYAYDTEANKYVLNVTKVAGTIILFFAVVIFVVLVISSKRRKNKAK